MHALQPARGAARTDHNVHLIAALTLAGAAFAVGSVLGHRVPTADTPRPAIAALPVSAALGEPFSTGRDPSVPAAVAALRGATQEGDEVAPSF